MSQFLKNKIVISGRSTDKSYGFVRPRAQPTSHTATSTQLHTPHVRVHTHIHEDTRTHTEEGHAMLCCFLLPLRAACTSLPLTVRCGGRQEAVLTSQQEISLAKLTWEEALALARNLSIRAQVSVLVLSPPCCALASPL